jgi:protein-arginine deiminase
MLKRELLIAFLAAILLGGCQALDGDHPSEQQKVILVTPNLDDDDGDGKPDASDEIINGPADRQDLTRIQIPATILKHEYRFSGPGADLYRVLEITESSSSDAIVWIEAKEPRSAGSRATLMFSEDAWNSQSHHAQLDIRPFVLSCNIEPVKEVFISDVEASAPVISQLEAHFESIPNAPILTVVNRGKYERLDPWIQDATEIGGFADTTISVAIAGLRGKHGWALPVNLDNRFSEVFCGPDRCVLHVGEALPNRDYIDWFGNLELTPPFVGADGTVYPLGRILVGSQNGLTMHDEVMTFLRAQEKQWPPITLDTGFLWIGHVDEIVNFIPTDTGFKALVASPTLGRELLEELNRQGHGDAVILKGLVARTGEPAEITVESVLTDSDITTINDSAEKVMIANRRNLRREMNLTEDDIIDLPVMFWKKKGEPLWPNPVNGLVIGSHYIISMPRGPMIDGRDAIEEAYRRAFNGTGLVLHFIDAWNALSKRGGDIHCGTNTVRRRL